MSLLQFCLLLHLLLLDHPHGQVVQQRRPLRSKLVRVQHGGGSRTLNAASIKAQVPGLLFSGAVGFQVSNVGGL